MTSAVLTRPALSLYLAQSVRRVPWLGQGYYYVQRLRAIRGQCCLRVAAGPCLPKGPIMQLSPYLTLDPSGLYLIHLTHGV